MCTTQIQSYIHMLVPWYIVTSIVLQHQHLHHKAIEKYSIGIKNLFHSGSISFTFIENGTVKNNPNFLFLVSKFLCSFGRTKVKGKKMKACIIETSSTLQPHHDNISMALLNVVRLASSPNPQKVMYYFSSQKKKREKQYVIHFHILMYSCSSLSLSWNYKPNIIPWEAMKLTKPGKLKHLFHIEEIQKKNIVSWLVSSILDYFKSLTDPRPQLRVQTTKILVITIITYIKVTYPKITKYKKKKL